MRWSRTLFWVFVACLAGAVLGLTVDGLMVANVPGLGLLIFILWFAVLYLIPAIVCARVLESGRSLLIPIIGLCAASIGFGLWLLDMAWELVAGIAASHIVHLQVPIAAIVIASCTGGILMTMRLQRRWEQWIRRVTLLMLGVGVIYATAATWSYHTQRPDLSYHVAQEKSLTLFRYGGIILLVVCAGVFALGIAHYDRRIRASECDATLRLPVRLRCPRCGEQQSLTTEGDSCTSCGLRITVKTA